MVCDICKNAGEITCVDLKPSTATVNICACCVENLKKAGDFFPCHGCTSYWDGCDEDSCIRLYRWKMLKRMRGQEHE